MREFLKKGVPLTPEEVDEILRDVAARENAQNAAWDALQQTNGSVSNTHPGFFSRAWSIPSAVLRQLGFPKKEPPTTPSGTNTNGR